MAPAAICPSIRKFALLMLIACGVAAGSQVQKNAAAQRRGESVPALSAQEIFKLVSPSVMVVESLDGEGKVTAFGSGVVIAQPSKDDSFRKLEFGPPLSNEVVTNRHVIEDGTTYRVEDNGKTWPAKVVKVDPDHDLAELSVTGLWAPPVTVRDSSKLAVGETVYAVGAPEGLELTISEGLISGLRDFDKDRVIQTSAAISPGSSGGGLFDAQGRLVGITTFYLKEGQSLNFALPAEWTVALDSRPATASPPKMVDSPDFQALVSREVGAMLAKQGDYAGATRALEQSVRLKPDDQIAWHDLGIAYYLLEQYERALSAYQEAIRLKPDDEAAWFGSGSASDMLGKHKEAVNAYQEAIRLKPNDEAAWLGLAEAYYGLRLYQIAVFADHEAMRLDPKDSNAWKDLGDNYVALGHFDKAESAYREATRLDPHDATTWYSLGVVCNEQGERSEVIKVYEKLKTIDPKLADEFFKAAVLP